ncbi:hypothetical protein CR513_37803, partial [Mucuna pruriens]
MRRSPKQNGVAERCNKTLKDMMRSMMSRCNLQKYLWGEALKTTLYIINRVPIPYKKKRIPKRIVAFSLDIFNVLKDTSSFVLIKGAKL